MRNMTAGELKNAVNGAIYAGREDETVTRAVIDSREAGKGDVFFAMKGEKNDGHNFLEQVFSSGCRMAVVSDEEKASKYAGRDGVTLIMVEDTMKALQTLGTYYLGTLGLKTKVGVTGSVGKTSTRDFLYYVLSGKYKTAGFLHEIILMNYSGIRLTPAYLQQAYALCHESDTLTLSDEIQSCMWYDGMFLFKKYGLTPDFVIIGKGFPGGEYAASKVITTAEADTLNQFGALVTNGQEELASLAYLITMEFSRANGDRIEEMGEKVEASLRGIAAEFPALLDAPEGLGHLSAIHFREGEKAAEFSVLMGSMCVDMSAQLYKADCPPAVLLKLPLICDETLLEVVCDRVRQGLKALA